MTSQAPPQTGEHVGAAFRRLLRVPAWLRLAVGLPALRAGVDVLTDEKLDSNHAFEPVKTSRAPLRVAQRLFLWLGCAAVAAAGGTAVYGDVSQRYHSRTFDHAAAAPLNMSVVEAAVDLMEGDTIGRLEIPRIGISVMVLHGTEVATLIAGAGHVYGTPSPGGEGNVVIAAHRDTFFRKLEGIQAGDRIRIATTGHIHEYVVDSTETVDPDETRVMESRGRSELTLITCYPFYFVGSAPKRFIVHARPL